MVVLVCADRVVAAGEGGEQGFTASLVWGTNTAEPADSVLKPVSEEVSRKLGKLPFKWRHYYLVEKKEIQVATGQPQTVRLSEQCEIIVKPLDQERVELSLRGEGKPVGKVTQKLPSDELLVTGGNAENLTAWFVVLRRSDGGQL